MINFSKNEKTKSKKSFREVANSREILSHLSETFSLGRFLWKRGFEERSGASRPRFFAELSVRQHFYRAMRLCTTGFSTGTPIHRLLVGNPPPGIKSPQPTSEYSRPRAACQTGFYSPSDWPVADHDGSSLQSTP